MLDEDAAETLYPVLLMSSIPDIPSPVVVWPSVAFAPDPATLVGVGPPVDVVLAALQLSRLANTSDAS